MLNISVKVKTFGTSTFIERKDNIDFNTFTKEDVLTTQVDTLHFTTKKTNGKTWTPSVGDEIIAYDGIIKIFGGFVIKVDETIEGANLLEYAVSCKDYTQTLDGNLVFKEYTNTTVNAIIADILANFVTGFTGINVNCDLSVTKIKFNYEPISKCLQKLADLYDFNWYVDYDKDIHFFAKFGEVAPYNLTDDNGKYIFGSLKITNDLSQIRNIVYVRGAKFPASPRSEKYVAVVNQTAFPLAYEYPSKPSVTKNGSSQTVGIDGLDTVGSYNCMWNSTSNAINFNSALSAGDVVIITGTPNLPVLALAKDQTSIDKYGKYEHKIIDKLATSQSIARDRANAEIVAYSNPLQQATFQTYESGLRSGQLINVQSTIRGIDQNYSIQKVILKMIGANQGIWEVTLTSVKVTGIMEFLQGLLQNQSNNADVNDNEVIELIESLLEFINISEEINVTSQQHDYNIADMAEVIRNGITIDSYSEANQDTDSDLYAGDKIFIGQAGFLVTEDCKIAGADFYLFKTGNPTGNAVAKLYAVTGSVGSYVPTGSPLATSDNFDVTQIPAGRWTKFFFNFSGANRVAMNASTRYVIVLNYAGGDASNRVDVGCDQSSPTHAGNYVYSLDGSNWVALSGLDVCFAVYGVLTKGFNWVLGNHFPTSEIDSKRNMLLDRSAYLS